MGTKYEQSDWLEITYAGAYVMFELKLKLLNLNLQICMLACYNFKCHNELISVIDNKTRNKLEFLTRNDENFVNKHH